MIARTPRLVARTPVITRTKEVYKDLGLKTVRVSPDTGQRVLKLFPGGREVSLDSQRDQRWQRE